MQKLYDEISKIHTEQLKLESMVTELEHKTEEIDLSSQVMMSNFYLKYLCIFIL